MALTGGTVLNPRTGQTVSWRPTAGVADDYNFVVGNRSKGYQQLGVIGNKPHLAAANPGDHTPFSTHSTVVDGKTVWPKRNWVYANDSRVPEPAKFEKWFLGRLRAGAYPYVKYWNILNRHHNRKAVKDGIKFAYSVYSGDDHLHISYIPGAEYTRSTIFADYERYRTTGRNAPVAKLAPKPTTPVTHPAKTAASKLPQLSKGATGRAVAIAQASLTVVGQRTAIDSDFGPTTDQKVRGYQRAVGLNVDGIIGPRTWDSLLPNAPATVIRGSEGQHVRLLQALLTAHGFRTAIDGDAGDQTIANLKKFQAARRVANSVVGGRGDGIGGPATWAALLTP